MRYHAVKEITMKLLSFGEILFDVFGDTATLGGAPLNVAAHYRQLGGESSIISAVGNDELGERALDEIENLDVDSAMIEMLDGTPTGRADITLHGKDATYEFNYPAAWDRIRIYDDDIDEIEDGNTIIYFGTLALRSTASFLSLQKLLGETAPAEVFVDINLRKDFYSDDILSYCLDNATILKINEDEIEVLSDMLALEKADGKELSSWLFDNTAVETLLLTRGKKGSDLFIKDEKPIHVDCSNVNVVDTVGAGDSLSAAYLFFRYEKKLSPADALFKATAVADYVVSHKGAIPSYDASLFV